MGEKNNIFYLGSISMTYQFINFKYIRMVDFDRIVIFCFNLYLVYTQFFSSSIKFQNCGKN